MCINYIPIPKAELVEYFHAEPPENDWPEETWQDYAAPIIVAGDLARQAMLASFGFVPKAKLPSGSRYSTMNARAETLGQLPSYRDAWQMGRFCLVPMRGFFEPCYESGRAVRHLIEQPDGAPFAVAGIWRAWAENNGRKSYSFTQITINADAHPLMRRMHKPGDEKRSLVIIPANQYDAWLDCQSPAQARTFLQPFAVQAMQARVCPLTAVKNIPCMGSLF